MILVLWALTVLWATSTFALSFGPNTIFLNISDQQECEEAWAFFTEWYGEIYCTTTPEEVLTNQQKDLVVQAASTIVSIIGSDETLAQRVDEKLQEYSSRFAREWNIQKQALALQLRMEIDKRTMTIPNNCSVRYDGCNTCQSMENWELACTKMACQTNGDSRMQSLWDDAKSTSKKGWVYWSRTDGMPTVWSSYAMSWRRGWMNDVPVSRHWVIWLSRMNYIHDYCAWREPRSCNGSRWWIIDTVYSYWGSRCLYSETS